MGMPNGGPPTSTRPRPNPVSYSRVVNAFVDGVAAMTPRWRRTRQRPHEVYPVQSDNVGCIAHTNHTDMDGERRRRRHRDVPPAQAGVHRHAPARSGTRDGFRPAPEERTDRACSRRFRVSTPPHRDAHRIPTCINGCTVAPGGDKIGYERDVWHWAPGGLGEHHAPTLCRRSGWRPL